MKYSEYVLPQTCFSNSIRGFIHSLGTNVGIVRWPRLPLSIITSSASARHAFMYECTARGMWKKLKSSDSGDSGSKKCECGYGGAYGGVWRSLLFEGVWSQAVGFVLVRSCLELAVKIFSYLIYCRKTF